MTRSSFSTTGRRPGIKTSMVAAPFSATVQRAPGIHGRCCLPCPFVIGLWCKMRAPTWIPLTTSFLLFFLLHTVFRAYGLFGEAGYPRYMVSVAPAIAVLSLAGWNTIAMVDCTLAAPFRRVGIDDSGHFSGAKSFSIWTHFLRRVIPLPFVKCPDGFKSTLKPYHRLVWSNARMCIVSGSKPCPEPVSQLPQPGSHPCVACGMRLRAPSFSGTIISARTGSVSRPEKSKRTGTSAFAPVPIRCLGS